MGLDETSSSTKVLHHEHEGFIHRLDFIRKCCFVLAILTFFKCLEAIINYLTQICPFFEPLPNGVWGWLGVTTGHKGLYVHEGVTLGGGSNSTKLCYVIRE